MRGGLAVSDGDHFKVFLAGTAFRTSPVHGYLVPACASGNTLFGQASRFVVDPSADEAHPGLVFLLSYLVVAHSTALQVKCKSPLC